MVIADYYAGFKFYSIEFLEVCISHPANCKGYIDWMPDADSKEGICPKYVS